MVPSHLRAKTRVTRTGAMLMHTPAVTSEVLVSKVQDSGIAVGYRFQVLLGRHRLRKGGHWLGYDPFLSTDFSR